MDNDSSISSSNFLTNDFFTDSDEISEYVDLPCRSNFNRIYKVKRYGQWFVLKALRPEFLGQPLYVSLLKKEYELSSQLNHPYIVKVIKSEFNPRVGPSIMMEYVDGVTLSEFLKTNPDKETRLRIVYQILDAMNYFHSKQIVHRDLKPSNILITHNGHNVKIIDFGLADADSYAVFKQPAGTIRYAAPEQVEGNILVDCRADIYSFGKILQLIFPHRYLSISRKCIRNNRDKRYSDSESVIKDFRFHRHIRRGILLFIFLLVMFVPSILLLTKYGPNQNDFAPSEQLIISEASDKIDSIYLPVYDALNSDMYCYREFATLDILSTYDAVNNIRSEYESRFIPESLFSLQFVSAYQYKWGKILQDLDSALQNIPSLYESYSSGVISLDEFTKNDAIYKERLSRLNK